MLSVQYVGEEIKQQRFYIGFIFNSYSLKCKMKKKSILLCGQNYLIELSKDYS